MNERVARTGTERRRMRRSRELEGFSAHLALFLTVNVSLFLINLVIGGPWWVAWVGAAWGIALLAHALQVFGPRLLIGPDWEERVAPQRIPRD